MNDHDRVDPRSAVRDRQHVQADVDYDFGVFNQMLGLVGIEPISWLGSTSMALWSVILVDIWHWVPFMFLILFAAVEGLPGEVLDAGRVDGANRRQLLRHVTLPLLKPAIVVALLFRSILAFKAFDEVYLLTGAVRERRASY